MKKVAQKFGSTVAILLMTMAVLTFLAPRFGWRVDTVFSGSMEPKLKVGSVVVTRPVKAEDIKVGDIITFYSPLKERLTSHRVIAVEQGSSFDFRTKGDASEDADPFLISAQNVVGKVCFDIPWVGYVTQFVKTPLGLLLIICIPGMVIIVTEIRSIWRVLNEGVLERKHGIR